MVPIRAALQTTSLIKTFLTPSTSRALSYIIKSPSLLSLDLADSWSSASQQSEHSSIGECQKDSTATIIDGKSIAEKIRSSIASEVRRMKELIGRVPGLAVILVGHRRDSLIYVHNKIIASEEVGIKYKMVSLPENCSEREVCNALCSFNEDPSIHGILVQLPLPHHMNEANILSGISLDKDVDGFHPLNIGNLAMQGMEPLFIPCTPKGCIELLLQSGIEIMGKNAVVIGRSNIVGLPTSLLLQANINWQLLTILGQRHHATVTVVHAYSKNLEKITREADILVTAAGVPNLVRGSWLKPDAVVVDVGTNPVENEKSEHGYRLVGDVCFKEAITKACAITPVPGGVGPMTVAMLLYNTLESAKRAFKFT
ncbi:bifunctional protein folD [Striga asiatica]|uniref:Bifunctional protein folD n=1 Tax=Striga asiatica TaxID=4170 RepID=A0A5A7RDK2_STRAF|nr:bifunctional protein folD [Striga asiatica]